MQVKKTDLDTQITNLECRKLGLEQSGRLVYRRENESSEINVEEKLDSHEDYSVNVNMKETFFKILFYRDRMVGKLGNLKNSAQLGVYMQRFSIRAMMKGNTYLGFAIVVFPKKVL